jgi:hypothetical protein
MAQLKEHPNVDDVEPVEGKPDFTYTTGNDLDIVHRRFIASGYYGEVHEVCTGSFFNNC